MRCYFNNVINYWEWMIDNDRCKHELVEDMILDDELTDSEVYYFVWRLRHEKGIC